MTSYTTFTLEQEGPVDWLTLNLPERINAITGTMVRELWNYFSGLCDDYSRRIVVMRGAGRGFCSGADLTSMAKPGELPMGLDPKGPSASLTDVIRLMRKCPQPIITLVHGAACGGGFAFALASDIRIAGQSARMNDAFIKLGISGCELGLSFFLPRMVGLSVASELMMTGRFIDADRALATGLVSRVVPDDQMADAARELIADMLRTSPLGLRKTKEILNLALKLNELDAVIEVEQYTQMSCMRSGDFEEAMLAFAERREPRFSV